MLSPILPPRNLQGFSAPKPRVINDGSGWGPYKHKGMGFTFLYELRDYGIEIKRARAEFIQKYRAFSEQRKDWGLGGEFREF